MSEDRCPNCGYCPHCGRSNQIHPRPWYPYTRPYPYYGDLWSSKGSSSMGSTPKGQYYNINLTS